MAMKMFSSRSGSTSPFREREARWQVLVVLLHVAAGLAAFVVGLVASPSEAQAEEAWPSRPHWIMPLCVVGSGPDAIVRVVR